MYVSVEEFSKKTGRSEEELIQAVKDGNLRGNISKEGKWSIFDEEAEEALLADIADRKTEKTEDKKQSNNEISPELLMKINQISFVTDPGIAGKKISETLGVARGATVRAKHIGRDITASLKSIVGGEIVGYTELLAEGREQAIQRMKLDAYKMGADAITSCRFSTSLIMEGAVEVMAYGTAIKVEER